MDAQLPSLVTTVAGTDSNAYVTLAFANAYFLPKLEWEEWEAFDAAQRSRAIVSATANIDSELRSFGAWYKKYDLVDPEQALMFPRAGDYDDNGDLEIPDAVEEATCLLALHLLQQKSGMLGPVDIARARDEGVAMIVAGGMTVSYKGGGSWTTWPRDVKRLMMGYVDRQGTGVYKGTIRERRWHEGWIARGS